jgi:hypothetical protein
VVLTCLAIKSALLAAALLLLLDDVCHRDTCRGKLSAFRGEGAEHEGSRALSPTMAISARQ